MVLDGYWIDLVDSVICFNERGDATNSIRDWNNFIGDTIIINAEIINAEYTFDFCTYNDSLAIVINEELFN